VKRGISVVFCAAIITTSLSGCAQKTKPDHHARISEDSYHRFETQNVSVHAFPVNGWLLAIGGGGEGIIGHLGVAKTVAIDISRRELAEAASGPLKVVMDARELDFLDGSFAAAASFFTLCYIDDGDHPAVMSEAWRVLEPGGTLRIWEISLGERPPDGKDRALIPLSVKLPDRTVETGYGVHWPAVPHDLPYYVALAEEAGFRVVAKSTEQQWLYLELAKD